MSKSEGRFITVKFTEPITSTPNVMAQVREERQDLVISANGSYSGTYPISNVLDGNTGTYWQSRSTANYIQIDLAQSARFVHGFKVYSGASYRPSNYTLSVSDDGTTYTTVKTDTIPAVTGWHELLLDAPVKTRFVRINFGYSSRLYLYEFILLVGSKIAGFTVKGQQYKYINGPLLDKEYVIENVSAHPTIDKAVLIEFNTFGRFPTVEGNLTVEYDASVGNLAGRGGFVESFIETFTPTDLVPEPNPGIEETITVVPASLEVDLLAIEYIDRFAEETITVAPATLEVELIHTSIINP
jgi:hypothetical protein